jgi:hypothetical protein
MLHETASRTKCGTAALRVASQHFLLDPVSLRWGNCLTRGGRGKYVRRKWAVELAPHAISLTAVVVAPTQRWGGARVKPAAYTHPQRRSLRRAPAIDVSRQSSIPVGSRIRWPLGVATHKSRRATCRSRRAKHAAASHSLQGGQHWLIRSD